MVVPVDGTRGGLDVWALSQRRQSLGLYSLDSRPGHCLCHPPLRLSFLLGSGGFSIPSSGGLIHQSHTLRTEATGSLRLLARLHSDLVASLRFDSHRQSDSHVLSRSLRDAPCTGNKIHSKLTANHPHGIFTYCVSANLESRDQAPPHHLFKTLCLLPAMSVGHHSRYWECSRKQGSQGLRPSTSKH